MLHTTFNQLKVAGACGQERGSGKGYDKLATHLSGTIVYGEDTLIPLDVVVESNGLLDAIWCLRATTEDFDTIVRPFIRSYLANVLEHLALRTSIKTKSLLDAASALLRSPADGHAVRVAHAVYYATCADEAAHYTYATDDSTSAAVTRVIHTAYYAAEAADDAAVATTARAAEAAALAAVATASATSAARATAAYATADYATDANYVAERKWQTEQFLSALQGEES